MTLESAPIDPQVQREAARRRTFAIISHPDAGKTTLTEKLLLYGGQVDVAGSVRGRKTQRAATSVPLGPADARSVMRLLEAIEDLDDVQAVHANAEFPEEVLACLA